jgi:hypothetical protein
MIIYKQTAPNTYSPSHRVADSREGRLKLTKRGKAAMKAAGVLLGGAGLTVGGIVGGSVAENVTELFDHTTDIQKLHNTIEEAKDNPAEVEPGKYVTYIASNGEGGDQIAFKLAKEGKADAIQNDIKAQEDENHYLQSGPILLEADAVNLQDHAVSEQVLPFPGPADLQ